MNSAKSEYWKISIYWLFSAIQNSPHPLLLSKNDLKSENVGKCVKLRLPKMITYCWLKVECNCRVIENKCSLLIQRENKSCIILPDASCTATSWAENIKYRSYVFFPTFYIKVPFTAETIWLHGNERADLRSELVAPGTISIDVFLKTKLCKTSTV